MTAITESLRTGEHMISEAPGTRSRDEITIISGAGVLVPGTVLGIITKAGTAAAAAFASNTGNGAMGTITVGAGAKPGDYKLIVTEVAANAGNFVVEDPDGKFVGQGDVAAAFSEGGLAFTLADGATDFAAGDGFTITVAAGSGKYKPYDNTATDGSEVAEGVLYAAVDATSSDIPAIAHVRDCEVAEIHLTGSDAGAIADLAASGVIVR